MVTLQAVVAARTSKMSAYHPNLEFSANGSTRQLFDPVVDFYGLANMRSQTLPVLRPYASVSHLNV